MNQENDAFVFSVFFANIIPALWKRCAPSISFKIMTYLFGLISTAFSHLIASFLAPQDEPVVHTDMFKDEGQTSSVSQKIEFAEFPNKDINRRIALASTVAAVGLFLSTRLEFGVSLKDLSAAAVPYEVVSSSSSFLFFVVKYSHCFISYQKLNNIWLQV